ncbi:hypothetical protein AAVH_05694 [Aphelenchoides avenae]|nr:hypothetical protein AAVH_05694 [Aphelenchus avenae]
MNDSPRPPTPASTPRPPPSPYRRPSHPPPTARYPPPSPQPQVASSPYAPHAYSSASVPASPHPGPQSQLSTHHSLPAHSVPPSPAQLSDVSRGEREPLQYQQNAYLSHSTQPSSGNATPTPNRASSVSGYASGQSASHLSPSYHAFDQYQLPANEQYSSQRAPTQLLDPAVYGQPPSSFSEEPQERQVAGRAQQQAHLYQPRAGASRSQPNPRVQMPPRQHEAYDSGGMPAQDGYHYQPTMSEYSTAPGFIDHQQHSEPASPLQHVMHPDQPPLQMHYGQQPSRKYERMMSMPVGGVSAQSDSAPGSVQPHMPISTHRPTSASSGAGRKAHAHQSDQSFAHGSVPTDLQLPPSMTHGGQASSDVAHVNYPQETHRADVQQTQPHTQPPEHVAGLSTQEHPYGSTSYSEPHYHPPSQPVAMDHSGRYASQALLPNASQQPHFNQLQQHPAAVGYPPSQQFHDPTARASTSQAHQPVPFPTVHPYDGTVHHRHVAVPNGPSMIPGTPPHNHRSLQVPGPSGIVPISVPTKRSYAKRRSMNPPRLAHLEKMLDLTGFIQQLERLIEQPIKIPGNISMNNGQARDRQVPGKAKRDLLSVDDIWQDKEQQREEKMALYNTSNVGERQWLLDLLLEESDVESGGEEMFTEDDLRHLLKIHRKRRKLQKECHNDIMNSQYMYYGAGLLSNHDRFPDHQAKMKREFE